MIDRWSSYVLRGLTVVLPIGATVWVVRTLFLIVDRWFQPSDATSTRIPGLGFVAILIFATVIGFFAEWRGTAGSIAWIENVLTRIPVVKLVYGTIKDFVDAFLGKKRRFDKPVLVRIGGDFGDVVGFVTSEDLGVLGIEGKIAVYIPQSYTIGGNLVILSRDRVTALAADSADVMAFLVSGGITRAATTGMGLTRIDHEGDPDGQVARVAENVRKHLERRSLPANLDRNR